MLLPFQVDLVMLGLAGIGLIGTIAYLIRGGRMFAVVVGGGVFTLVFAVLAVLTIGYTAEVVQVSGGTTIEVGREKLLFSTTIDLQGKAVSLHASDTTTFVINDTAKTLTVRAAVYSTASVGPNPPDDVTIAPFSIGRYPAHIDNLGPSDPLDSEVSSEASTVIKYWLTW